VENAVRYGVTKKEEGGTVTISVRKHDESVMVIIEDDGAGFSIDEKRQTVREHSGIYNVRERLRMQCGGDLIISSTPGKGTKAVIMIPLHAEDKTEIPFI
jgi:sensor histidine kinase YesM